MVKTSNIVAVLSSIVAVLSSIDAVLTSIDAVLTLHVAFRPFTRQQKTLSPVPSNLLGRTASQRERVFRLFRAVPRR